MVTVPAVFRTTRHPRTPDPKERISKRAFDKKLSLWRRNLHEYDPEVGDTMLSPEAAGKEASPIGFKASPGGGTDCQKGNVLSVLSPNTDSTESTRADSEAASPPAPVPPCMISRHPGVMLPLAELVQPPSNSAGVSPARASTGRSANVQQQGPASQMPPNPMARAMPMGLQWPPANPSVGSRHTSVPPPAPVAVAMAQMAACSGMMWQMTAGPGAFANYGLLPAASNAPHLAQTAGQQHLAPPQLMQGQHRAPLAMQLFPAEMPGCMDASMGLAVPEHFYAARERVVSMSSSSSSCGVIAGHPEPHSPDCDASVPSGQVGAKKLHIETRGNLTEGHGDSLAPPLSPQASQKPSDEPKTPPKKTMQHVYDSPTQGRITTRSPSSGAYGNTPSPQQASYRQRQCISTSQHAAAQPQAALQAQARAAQASTPGQAGVYAAYRMPAPVGPLGQPATPAQRSPLPPFPFAHTPQGPAGGMQAAWSVGTTAPPSSMPSMYGTPVVFHFGRPAPHIVTPAPPLPFSSPPLRQGTHGLTPGPKLSPPDACGGDRDAAMNEWRKWRHGEMETQQQ